MKAKTKFGPRRKLCKDADSCDHIFCGAYRTGYSTGHAAGFTVGRNYEYDRAAWPNVVHDIARDIAEEVGQAFDAALAGHT